MDRLKTIKLKLLLLSAKIQVIHTLDPKYAVVVVKVILSQLQISMLPSVFVNQPITESLNRVYIEHILQ